MKVDDKLEGRIFELCDTGELEDMIEGRNTEEVVKQIKTFIESIPTREDKVKEFHLIMNEVVNDKPTILDENTALLRLNLIQEELQELAEALGYGILPTKQGLQYIKWEQSPNPDLLKAFDAVIDLQYVLSGTIVSLGFSNNIDEGFDEVHRSNMSKFCNTFEEAEHESAGIFMTRGIKTIIEPYKDKYILKQIGDNKTIKPSTYSPANLQPIIDRHAR